MLNRSTHTPRRLRGSHLGCLQVACGRFADSGPEEPLGSALDQDGEGL
jgi:hypothetical protein